MGLADALALPSLGSLGALGGVNSAPVTPDAIKRKRALADALAKQGMDASPIRSPWQGAARLAQSLVGGLEDARANQQEAAAQADFNKQFMSAISPMLGGGSAMAPASTTTGAAETTAPARLPTFATDSGMLATELTKRGYSPVQAAGIIGNLAHESRLDPTNATGDNGTSGGLAQWHNDRWANLKNFAQGQGADWRDPKVQIAFLDNELHSTEAPTLSRLQAAKTPEEAAQAFIGFERPKGYTPDNPMGAMGAAQRVAAARSLYGQIAPQTGQGSPAGASGPALAYAGATPSPAAGEDATPAPAAVAASSPAAAQVAQATATTPQAQAAGAPKYDPQKLMAVITNPWASPAQAQVALALFQSMQKQSNPVTLSAGQTLFDPATGKAIYTAPKDDKAPASVQEYEYAKKNGYEGTFADFRKASDKTRNIEDDAASRQRLIVEQGGDPKDPRNQQYILTGKFPREDAQPLSATDKKAILEADEMVSQNESVISALHQAKELSKQAMGFPGASAVAKVGAVFGNEASQATSDLDNLMTSQALAQLKSSFGAAPTEGERKILLEIQGASSQPDEVRQKIYDRAIAMAEKRLEFNRQRASQLREGDFYKSGGGKTSAAPKEAAPAAPAAPKAGDVIDGYRFKGGNPADQNAWEKVQ
ncbi:MAG: phage tail tip lysozyme [bacterium]